MNLGSPKQLQAVLFDELGLPKTKKNKTGYTTDADALTWLLEQTGHPFIEHLLRHRDVTRLRTVIDGLLPTVDDDGRIHTTFQQTIAATGRLSSTDPNLQNIPIRTAEGRRIRQAFVVGQGFESLMTADYSQIEMRIMAHLSEDAGLIEAFTSGEDLHSFVASRAFGIPIEEVDPEMRRRIKAMSYGLAYGLSAYGLAQQLRITPEEAEGQMDAYFERFGGIRDYLDSVVDEARLTGYTETILGRRRYLPDLTSDNRQRREMAERMALNAPIQGSAADIIKVAMLRVEQALARRGAALPDAAAGARRAGARGGAGRAGGARGAGAPRDGRRRRALGRRWRSRWASAAAGTPRRTDACRPSTVRPHRPRSTRPTLRRPGRCSTMAFAVEFGDADWEHALGGMHVLALDGGRLVAHGCGRPATLVHRGRALRVGYVEAVAVAADHRRRGPASAVMDELEPDHPRRLRPRSAQRLRCRRRRSTCPAAGGAGRARPRRSTPDGHASARRRRTARCSSCPAAPRWIRPATSSATGATARSGDVGPRSGGPVADEDQRAGTRAPRSGTTGPSSGCGRASTRVRGDR